MANIFSDVNKAVKAYSFNKTHTRPIDNMSDSAAANSTLRKLKALEEEAALESSISKIERDSYYNDLNKGVVRKYIKDSRIPNNINRIHNEAKTAIFKDILFETFYNALLMDDDFLEENVNAIKYLTDKYIDDNGGFNLLENAINNNKDNLLLKKMKNVCESVAREVCARKLADSKECQNLDLIDFDMNEDEKNQLDYSKKDDLSIDRISELVKDKVLTVVKDEKEQHVANSELIENIENDLKEDESVTDEDSLNEAMSKIVLNKAVVETSTLFDAIFRDSYQEYILENVAIVSADKDIIDDDKKMSANYDTEMDEDDALQEEEPVEKTEVNMDLILTEAITKYTLMETLYTIGLENYSYENIRKLTERMLNPVHENVVTEAKNKEPKDRSDFYKSFNKLKDDPANETHRNNLADYMKSISDDKDECKELVEISKRQIDSIIEKNPNMKDKYEDLYNFIAECNKEEE